VLVFVKGIFYIQPRLCRCSHFLPGVIAKLALAIAPGQQFFIYTHDIIKFCAAKVKDLLTEFGKK
jgi:hypothetical protein